MKKVRKYLGCIITGAILMCMMSSACVQAAEESAEQNTDENLSAQVEELETRVSDLETEVATLKVQLETVLSILGGQVTDSEEGTENAEVYEEAPEENTVSQSFDPEWYKKYVYTDGAGSVMSFVWLDDGWFNIEFGDESYGTYDMNSNVYGITDEGFYRYEGDGHYIEYDATNNAVLVAPYDGASRWYYAY